MPQRTLVAYFSKGGAAEMYARVVADVLGREGHKVDVVDLRRKRRPELAPYRNVVLGTGVRIGMVYARGRRFLKRDDLRGKRLAIFLASGIAVENARESKRRFLEPLVEKYGLDPVMCDAFPGQMPGKGSRVRVTTDPQRASRWAAELAGKWAGPET